MRIGLIFFFLCGFLFADGPQDIDCTDEVAKKANPDFVAFDYDPEQAIEAIPNYRTLSDFGESHVDTRMGGAKINYSAKFFIVLDEKGLPTKIIFPHSRTYPFHLNFMHAHGNQGNITQDDLDELSLGHGRKCVMGSLFLEEVQGAGRLFRTSYELLATDGFDRNLQKQIHDLVHNAAKNVMKTGQFYYLPDPRIKVDPTVLASLGIEIDERTLGIPKQVYNDGWGFGYVRMMRKAHYQRELKKGNIKPTDILVLDEAPDELPNVQALILSQPTVRNSHAALVAKMRRMPMVYLENAFDIEALKKAHRSKLPVYFSVKDDHFSHMTLLGGLNPEDVDPLLQQDAPDPIGKLKINTEDKRILVDYGMTREELVEIIGAKAANLYWLKKEFPDHTPQKISAIPFAHYLDFLKNAKVGTITLKTFIQRQLKRLRDSDSPSVEAPTILKEIRDGFQNATVDRLYFSKLHELVRKVFPTPGLRIKARSSGRVEDVRHFNGAGLYTSKGFRIDDLASFEFALRTVWGSNYNLGAFTARQEFGVDESSAVMGILLNPSFKNEKADFVTIANSRRVRSYGNSPSWISTNVLTSAFPGEGASVANPKPGDWPEIAKTGIDRYDKDEKHPPDILQHTNLLPKGRWVLTPKKHAELADIVHAANLRWNGDAPLPESLDFEGKLMGNQLVLKQVRPLPDGQARSDLERISDTVVLAPKRGIILTPYLHERPDAALKSQADRPVRITMRSFSFDHSVLERSPFKKVEVQDPDGKWINIPIDPIQMNYHQTPWKPRDNGYEGLTEERTKTVEIDFSTFRSKAFAEFFRSKLKLSFELTETRDSSGRLIETVQPLSKLTARVSSSFNRQTLRDQARTPDFVYLPPEPVRWQLRFPDPLDKYLDPREPKRISYNIYAPDTLFFRSLGISISGTTHFGGFDKTMYLNIDKFKVNGLLSYIDKPDRTLELQQAAVHAPGHHNMFWQFGVDLLKAGLSQEELDQFKLKRKRWGGSIYEVQARYLVIESRDGATSEQLSRHMAPEPCTIYLLDEEKNILENLGTFTIEQLVSRE